MKSTITLAALALLGLFFAADLSQAYVEVPYSLGQVVKESTNIVLVEVTKVDKTKNLIIFKKLEDVKGKHNGDVLKHNIGKNGFHPREWQNIIAWAEEGKKAVFFHNGGSSETCIGSYWYQAYPQGEWWGMSHAEPFLLRTYCGDPEKLAAACKAIHKGEEVVVPCMADGNKDLLHQRKAKLQLMKASLKRANYDAKRDFVAFGGGDDTYDIPEFKTTVLMAESTAGWKFAPAKQVNGNKWHALDFDDKDWRAGQAPIGYGEEEIAKRKGVTLAEKGESFVFRRVVEITAEQLQQKNAQFKLNVASDDSADVWFNGEPVLQEGASVDHEYAYWNSEADLPVKVLKAGKNIIAVLVRNKPSSSDIYFDAELVAQVPVPKKEKPKAPVANPATGTGGTTTPVAVADDNKPPKGLTVDKAKKTVTIDCAVAPRKLPNLDKIYPIEVAATYPAPKGQKAHETIVTFTDLKPSHVHKALEECGIKAGKSAKGEGAKAEGPEVAISLEFTGADGKVQKVPLEKLLIDTKNGNKPAVPFKWLFTGSAVKNLDPEKDDKVYAADFTGTLITFFPVTDDTVFQTSLTMKEEGMMKFELAPNVLPKEGSPVKLIIEAK